MEGSNNNKLGSGDVKEGDKTKNSVQVSFTLGKQGAYKAENHKWYLPRYVGQTSIIAWLHINLNGISPL